MIDLHHLFPTPVWATELEIDNSMLVAYATHLKETSAGVAISNIGGWQSEKLIPSPDNQRALSPLIAELQKLLDTIGTDYNFKKPLRIIDIWININEKGNFNINHNHPGAALSGVYYIKTDGSGPLEFVRSATEGYFWQTFTNNSDNKETWTGYRFEPKEGRVILFPAWVEHSVAPCDSQRISIAFNAGF